MIQLSIKKTQLAYLTDDILMWDVSQIYNRKLKTDMDKLWQSFQAFI